MIHRSHAVQVKGADPIKFHQYGFILESLSDVLDIVLEDGKPIHVSGLLQHRLRIASEALDKDKVERCGRRPFGI